MKRDFSFGIIPILMNNDGVRLLLIQHNEGHWAFPKGHAEVGETPVQTAKRELAEETGLTEFLVDEKITFFEEYEVLKNGDKIPKTVTYFPAVVTDVTVVVQKSEIKDFGWFTFEDAQQRVTFDVTKKLLQELKPYLDRMVVKNS